MITVRTLRYSLLIVLAGAAVAGRAADKAVAKKPAPRPLAAALAPTLANVAYGKHPKQVLDFYKAESSKPTPLVFYIHGGAWMTGDKRRIGGVAQYLKAGISVVSVEYRFLPEAAADGERPPVNGPLRDVARALQFVRSKAGEWNLDKARIGASGGSAGAFSSLWLAFRPDMADPQSSDPVAHESTRLWCAAVAAAQTTADPKQMKDWTPNSCYGGQAFGFRSFQEFLAKRETILPLIHANSPYEIATADDPPVYLIYKTPPALGQPQQDPTHTANFGVKLQEKCRRVGIPCELAYPGAPDVKHRSVEAYLIERLKAPGEPSGDGMAASAGRPAGKPL